MRGWGDGGEGEEWWGMGAAPSIGPAMHRSQLCLCQYRLLHQFRFISANSCRISHFVHRLDHLRQQHLCLSGQIIQRSKYCKCVVSLSSHLVRYMQPAAGRWADSVALGRETRQMVGIAVFAGFSGRNAEARTCGVHRRLALAVFTRAVLAWTARVNSDSSALTPRYPGYLIRRNVHRRSAPTVSSLSISPNHPQVQLSARICGVHRRFSMVVFTRAVPASTARVDTWLFL